MTQSPDTPRFPDTPAIPASLGLAHLLTPETGRAACTLACCKAWLLLTIPFGFTTWAAFLYIGIRARRARWLVWAAFYAAMLAAYGALDSPAKPSSTAMGLAAGLLLAAWIGGGIHAIAVSDDAVRRIQGQPIRAVVEAAETRIERRAAGRQLLASQPALASRYAGAPDIAEADDGGLVDVNHVLAAVLTRLPGVTGASGQPDCRPAGAVRRFHLS